MSILWHRCRLADVAPIPWRNGGGLTRELAAWPDQGDWQWRVSVAEVARDGPFSRFEGVDRQFAVLSGAGVRLCFADQSHALTAQDAPFAFSGEDACDCQLLDGTTLDFNLMSRGLNARMMRFTEGSGCLQASAGDVVGCYALASAQVQAGDELLALTEHSMCWARVPEAMSIQVLGASCLGWTLTPVSEPQG
jgi:environmental stress-induced protein Ves